MSKDVFKASVYNKGYFGKGSYKSKDRGKHTKNYSTWRSMIQRCYGPYDRPTYEGCSVCSEWLNFQKYSDWFFLTYKEGYKLQLDKDILSGGHGKVYSPSTCCWVPSKINSLLTERTNCRGDCPLGVYYNKTQGMYIAQLAYEGRSSGSKIVGRSYDMYEAFSMYKEAKERRFLEYAEEFKGVITPEVYLALINLKVIDDSVWEAHTKI